ncbi:VanZ family protein [Phormidium sp. CCY1219]|uniref:VanZ family protein n=1 Tax=Phormidium sp. CCY1219 TaxID=2886104 RepID=UPI002D1E775C|nr:VanZ family protein [Phormidium sp. CCY1219]MEB3828150.1 VanZ family protein [Phormidium sp. CCY1219]
MKMNRKGWAIAGLIYLAILLTIMGLANGGKLPLGRVTLIPNYDLIGHFILYGIASFLSHRALGKKMMVLFTVPVPFGPFIFSLFTIAEEMLQVIFPTRSSTVADLAASLMGIIAFYAIGEFWDESRERIHH